MTGRRTYIALAVFLAFASTACVTADGSFTRAEDGRCRDADHLTHVSGGNHCLALETVVRPAGDRANILLVTVHGDGTPGQWATQLRKWMAEGLKFGSDVAVVDVARPGFVIATGKSSGAYVATGVDNYRNENVRAVMEAIANLKRHYGADKVVTLSRSGGSAIVAIGLGLLPDLAPNEAILVACPCDTVQWQSHTRSRSPPINSPLDYVGGIGARTKVTAITGSRDDNTIPELAKGYVAAARAKGIDALFYIAEGYRHIPSSGAPIVRKQLERTMNSR